MMTMMMTTSHTIGKRLGRSRKKMTR
jgi:hypothetical protein